MIEAANNNIQEARVDLGPQGQEFVPDLGGLVGRISGLIRSRLTMAVGIVLAAIGAGTACTPAGTDSPNKPVGIYGTQTGALDLTNVPSIGPGQPIPWSVKGNVYSNYAEINSKKYIFAAGGDDEWDEAVGWNEGESGGVAYVKCQAMEDCLSPNAEIQTVQGLVAAGLPYIAGEQWPGGPPLNMISAGVSGAYQDKDGNNKLLVDSEGGVHQCDIAPNADTVLEAANCAKLEPPMEGEFSIFKKSGKPYALWLSGAGATRRDLYLGDDKDLTPPLKIGWVINCGPGFEGDIDAFPNMTKGVVASEMLPKENWWDDTKCRLVTAKNWQELNDNPIPLDILNAGSDLVRRPRLADNYLLYARYDYLPNGSCCQSGLWYAPIPPAPQNPEPDADNVQPDTIVIPPDNGQDLPPAEDTTTQPDSDDVAEKVAETTDAIVIPPDTSVDASADTDFDTGPDANSNVGSDTSADTSFDANSNVGSDTSADTSFDANSNTGSDTSADTSFDTGADTGSDTGFDAGADTDSDAGGTPDPGQNKVDTQSEIVPEQNTSITQPSIPSKTSNDSGCQAGPDSPSSNPETAGLMLAALASLAMSKRRQGGKIEI